jgi:hypothetical protein
MFFCVTKILESDLNLNPFLPGKEHPKPPGISQIWATFGTIFFSGAVFSVFWRNLLREDVPQSTWQV